MRRLAKMGLFAATAILLAAPGAVAFADPDIGGPGWGAVEPDCWLTITNASAQRWQYETLNGRDQVMESGGLETRVDTNFSVIQDSVNGTAFGDEVRYVRVWTESGAGFDETFTLEVDDLSTCEAAIYGTMTDELGHVRVTQLHAHLTLLD
jgi:hypothetical protein